VTGKEVAGALRRLADELEKSHEPGAVRNHAEGLTATFRVLPARPHDADVQGPPVEFTEVVLPVLRFWARPAGGDVAHEVRQALGDRLSWLSSVTPSLLDESQRRSLEVLPGLIERIDAHLEEKP
jgi:hypothetical protein